MTTNNHPAHGPVSLDRLHQIREILSKAAAQSDGGNLGYAMADAVKVIDGAIAAFGAEPVAYWRYAFRADGFCYADGINSKKHHDAHPLSQLSDGDYWRVTPLYSAPPAPVVPEEIEPDSDNTYDYVDGWNACRAAMLQAGNSPKTPDGWQLVPKEPTAAMNKAGWDAMNEHDAINPTYRAMLAAAPQQENV